MCVSTVCMQMHYRVGREAIGYTFLEATGSGYSTKYEGKTIHRTQWLVSRFCRSSHTPLLHIHT